MKKWKQLVVFVMILTMVMGMTSFAANDSGIASGAKVAGVRAATPTDPTPQDPEVKPPVDNGDDNQDDNNTTEPETPSTGSDVTGAIDTEAAPAATVDAKTAVVDGREVEVELVVQTIDAANKEVEKIKTALKAQAAALTGFKADSRNKTFLFDVDLLIKGGGSVGTTLDQPIAVSIDCGSRFPAGTTKDNLRVLHYSSSKGAWEKRKILSYVNGVVTAEFDSFSPVALSYSAIAVPDEDSELTTSTNDAWKLTSGIQKNKYNVITLTWNKLGGKKDRYEIGFFKTPEDANPYKIVTTKKTSYKFSKAVCGNEYFFKVRVKGSSAWSDTCYAYTTLEGKGAPQITSVKTTYNTITIKWKKVTGAKGYAIYDSPSAETPIATVKGTKVTFKNVATGLSFQYFVRPVRENSVGDVSEAATGTTELQALKGVKVRGLDSASVKVTWSKVKGATGYYVEIWCDQCQRYESIDGEMLTPVVRNSLVVYGLDANRSYKFRVTPLRGSYDGTAGEGQGRTKNVPN